MEKPKLTPEERAEGARSFARCLEGVADGKMIGEASEEFWALLRDVMMMAKSRGPDGEAAGSFTLTLKISANARHEAEIGYDMSVKKPKKKRLTAMAWITKGGNITFEVPRQLGLPHVREVETSGDTLSDNESGEMLRS
jgi:hypothetical protein